MNYLHDKRLGSCDRLASRVAVTVHLVLGPPLSLTVRGHDLNDVAAMLRCERALVGEVDPAQTEGAVSMILVPAHRIAAITIGPEQPA